MRRHWLIETFTRFGRPVVFLAVLCLTLGLLFAAVAAKEIALVMLLSGGVALTTLAVLGYQRRVTPLDAAGSTCADPTRTEGRVRGT